MSAQNGPATMEDLSHYLKNFDKMLDEMLTGQKKCSLQLRDLTLFKTIKHKIENYPILNELYDRLETRTSVNKLRETMSQAFISNANSRPMSALTAGDRSTASLRSHLPTLKDQRHKASSKNSLFMPENSEISAGLGHNHGSRQNLTFNYGGQSLIEPTVNQNDVHVVLV